MNKTEFIKYDLNFVGLKEKVHHINYELNATFFEIFDYTDIKKLEALVRLSFDKKSTYFKCGLNLKGKISAICDISLEPFMQTIEGNLEFIIKFADDYNNDNEELLLIPHGDYKFNFSQQIYELILLNIPLKTIHPDVKNGTMKSVVLDKQKEFAFEEEQEEETIDPRWAVLNKLKNNKE